MLRSGRAFCVHKVMTQVRQVLCTKYVPCVMGAGMFFFICGFAAALVRAGLAELVPIP